MPGDDDEDNLDYRYPDLDFNIAEDDEDESWECAFPERCLMSGEHLRSECFDQAMAEDLQDEAMRDSYAKTDAELLVRLKSLEDELHHYSYTRQTDGRRFGSWEEIARAYQAIQEVIVMLRPRRPTDPGGVR